MSRSDDRAAVPCGDCHLCCKMMTILLPEEGDKIEDYKYAFWLKEGKMVPILDRRENGDCVYLGQFGCTIHDRAPVNCRKYDCRQIFSRSNRVGRRLAVKQGRASSAILARGRELLRQHPL